MARMPAPGWAVTCVSVIVLTTLGAAAPVARGLYEDAYPGQGSNITTAGKLEHALIKARLTTSFNPPTLTENEPSTFTATIIYGSRTTGGPTLNVAYANDALLAPASNRQFDIRRLTDRRQNLDEGHKRPAGGYELDWRWEVTPRATGSLSLALEIQPVLVLIGSNRTDLETRNKPIDVTVKVNPATTALLEVQKAAENLQVAYPTSVVVGDAAEWSATLGLQGHASQVQVKIKLVPDVGSASSTITSRGSKLADDQLFDRWTVTPTDPGAIKLKFAVDLSARAGDKTIRRTTEMPAAAIAHVEPSFWERVQAPFNWLTPLVALIVAVVGLRAAWGGRRRANDDGETTRS